MNNKTTKVIYKMLTEDTGKHFLDSGGENGRHWQYNQKKSIKDFMNEPEISKDDDIITKSLFHHLNESCEYLPDDARIYCIVFGVFDWIFFYK